MHIPFSINYSYNASVYIRDSLPYIPGSYYKTTTFVIENNVSPLSYQINKTNFHRTHMIHYVVSARVFYDMQSPLSYLKI